MNRCAAAVVMVLALGATTAFGAEGRGYIGFSAGAFVPHTSEITDNVGDTADVTYEPGFSLSGVGGYEFGNGLRLEGELVYKQAELDRIRAMGTSVKIDCDVWSVGGMANVYYDTPTGSIVTPYIGGGIGFASMNVGNGSVNGRRIWEKSDDTVFAYQVAAGLGIAVSRNVTLDLGYRYYGTEDVDYELAKSDFGSSNVTFGFRFRF